MSETMTIMIDDTDPSIKYSGSWVADKGSLDSLGNFGAPYMSTSHYTKGTGSFSFTFTGTYVGVFGSSVDGKNPSRVCTVDGVTIPNNDITAEVNQIMHCQVDGLPNGQHTLVVTVPTANPNGYWFDNLLYIPSASVSRADAALLVQWNDPSMAYGTGWAQSSPGSIGTVNGATMTIQFTGRTLTWIGYYLSQFPFTATTGTYTVDGGSPNTFDINGIAAQSTGAELNQRFFTTGMLSQGQHTLKVTYNGNSGTTPLSIYAVIVQSGASAGPSVGGAIGPSHPSTVTVVSGGGGGGGGSTVTVGGSSPTAPSIPPSPMSSVVVIGSGASAVTVTVSNTNSTATTLLPVPIGSASGSSTLTSAGAASSDKSSSGGGTSSDSNSANSGNSGSSSNDVSGAASKGHSHLGAIIGAVVGVLALILLLLLLVFFLRRRHRKRRERATNANASRSNLIAQPFTTAPTSFSPPPMSEYPPSSEYSTSSGAGAYAPVPNSQFYSDVKRPLAADAGGDAGGPSMTQPIRGFHPVRQPSQSLSTFSSPATVTSDATESEVIMLHEDSGVRIPMQPTRPGVTVVEMPPTYSAT